MKWVGGRENGEWKPFLVDSVEFSWNGTPKYLLLPLLYKGAYGKWRWGGGDDMRSIDYWGYDERRDPALLGAIPKPVL